MLSCTVCLAITVALGAFYFMETFRELAGMYRTSLIRADVSHPHMVIATMDVEGIYYEGIIRRSSPSANGNVAS